MRRHNTNAEEESRKVEKSVMSKGEKEMEEGKKGVW